MPPRFAYWTILVGGLPTAFRAAEREEIEPTFKQLQQKHPDAEMRWFARGKLWASPEESSEALARHKAQGKRQNEDLGDRRDRNWRPGGSHRDPRQPYIDAKKRENQRKRERRFEFKKGPRPPASGFRRKDDQPKWDRPPAGNKPRGTRPEWKPGGQPGPKTEDRRPKTGSDRPAWDRGPKPKWRDRDRDERHKAQGTGHKDEQKPWERSGPKWRPPRQEGPKTEDPRPKTGNDRPTWNREFKPKWSDRPKWGPPKTRDAKPKIQGQRPDGDRPRPQWKNRPAGDRPPKPKWQPRPEEPKTEDRRPKTGSGPGTGRGRWGAPSGGPRNGPGRGRRK